MFRKNTTPTSEFDLDAEAEAHAAGYWWRGGYRDDPYGEYRYGSNYATTGRRPLAAGTEAEARRGMVQLYKAGQAREARRALEEAQWEQEQARKADEERRRQEADRRVTEANAANAEAAGFRITRRPNRNTGGPLHLPGWSMNGSVELGWESADAAIRDQADAADRTRAHRAYVASIRDAVTAEGGEVRRERGGTLSVHLPMAHPRAPRNGEVINGMIAAFTGRGWVDIAEWWGGEFDRPDDYPEWE